MMEVYQWVLLILGVGYCFGFLCCWFLIGKMYKYSFNKYTTEIYRQYKKCLAEKNISTKNTVFDR